jgi:hypothetical protein
MFKVELAINSKVVKVKYLSQGPDSFQDLLLKINRMVQSTKIACQTSLELQGVSLADPCGDWVSVEDDEDLRTVYKLVKIAEQKIIKIHADFNASLDKKKRVKEQERNSSKQAEFVTR